MLGYHPPRSRQPPGPDTPLDQTPRSRHHPPRPEPPWSRHHPPPRADTTPLDQNPPRPDTPPEQTPLGSRRQHTVNERPVCILLECILVKYRFCTWITTTGSPNLTKVKWYFLKYWCQSEVFFILREKIAHYSRVLVVSGTQFMLIQTYIYCPIHPN